MSQSNWPIPRSTGRSRVLDTGRHSDTFRPGGGEDAAAGGSAAVLVSALRVMVAPFAVFQALPVPERVDHHPSCS